MTPSRGPMGANSPPLTILVVEDCPSDQSAIKRVIEDGYFGSAVIVPKITAAHAVLDGGTFDLVILDLLLPDSRDPIATLDAIQLCRGNAPVIVVTGIDDPAILEAAARYKWPVVCKDSDSFAADLAKQIGLLLDKPEGSGVTTCAIRQQEPPQEHYVGTLDAGVGMFREILKNQGLTGALLTAMICLSIYRDVTYSGDQAARTLGIQATAAEIKAQFETAKATMADAKTARMDEAKLIRSIQEQQAQDAREFHDFQRQIVPVIEAVRLLLERIDRNETAGLYRRRDDSGEEKGSTKNVTGDNSKWSKD